MLGIDVGKDSLSVTLVHPTTRQVQWSDVVPNSPAGIRALLQRTPCEVAWVLEPTGRYGVGVVTQAQAADRQVLLAPPRKAKAFLASIQSRAKTDRLDGQGLALYGLSVPLRPYPIKREAVDQLDQLLAARRGIAQAIASLGQQRAALPYATEVLTPAIAALEAQRTAIDRHIATCTADATVFPAVAALDAVPGIGPVTAAALAACLHSKSFSHPDAFVAYLGLDVRVRDSGQHRGKRKLSKQGDPHLRQLLFLCARASLLSKRAPFTPQYERERAKGLSPVAALNAVARKLARLCWSLARHGTTFDPDRVYRQPSRVRKGTPHDAAHGNQAGGQVGNSTAQPESEAVVHLSTGDAPPASPP